MQCNSDRRKGFGRGEVLGGRCSFYCMSPSLTTCRLISAPIPPLAISHLLMQRMFSIVIVEADESLLQTTDSNDNLPLHLACHLGNCAVVSYIMEMISTHGVSLKNKRGEGKTPLQLLLLESKCDRHSL